jgi:hypothetical protein
MMFVPVKGFLKGESLGRVSWINVECWKMDEDRRKFLKVILAALLTLVRETGGKLLPAARAAGRKGEEPKMSATTEGVEISAREYWNKTGIILTKGKRYSFVAEGEWRRLAPVRRRRLGAGVRQDDGQDPRISEARVGTAAVQADRSDRQKAPVHRSRHQRLVYRAGQRGAVLLCQRRPRFLPEQFGKSNAEDKT